MVADEAAPPNTAVTVIFCPGQLGDETGLKVTVAGEGQALTRLTDSVFKSANDTADKKQKIQVKIKAASFTVIDFI